MDRPAAWRENAVDLEAERPFRIGGATVDPISREATYEAGHERLQPQTLKVLIALKRRNREVVTRSELIDGCWGGRIVGEDVINRSRSFATLPDAWAASPSRRSRRPDTGLLTLSQRPRTSNAIGS